MIPDDRDELPRPEYQRRCAFAQELSRHADQIETLRRTGRTAREAIEQAVETSAPWAGQRFGAAS